MLVPLGKGCAKTPRRAFTLPEIMVVLFLISLVTALTLGALRRYNAQNDLHRATERLMAELVNAQTESRAFGTPQQRGSNSPPLLTASANQGSATFLHARTSATSPAQSMTHNKEWSVGDEQGSAIRLQMITSNLPALPYTSNTTDFGYTLELGELAAPGAPFNLLASVAFQPDGSVLVVNVTVPTTIVVGNGISNQTITLTSLGKASLSNGP